MGLVGLVTLQPLTLAVAEQQGCSFGGVLMEQQHHGEEDEACLGRMVLVTVGSTQFEDLLEVVDSAAFVETLVAMGGPADKRYEALVVQYGPHAAHAPRHLPALTAAHGLTYRAFPISPAFPALLAQAALVISHAGTCLASGMKAHHRVRKTNRGRLMNMLMYAEE